MIDIHTHIIPNIDDGSKNVKETFEMIQEAEKAGFTDIITTSHYMENAYEVDNYNRKLVINALQKKIKEKKIKIKLYNGAEIYIHENMVDSIEKNIIPTLAESKYVLFELPLNTEVLYADNVIEKLISNEYIPIIAHPERYMIVQENYEIIENWIDKGVLFQCNFTSILGMYGEKAKKVLLKLLKDNYVHFLGTDAHRPKQNYALMGECLAKFEKKIGEQKLLELTTENPKKVISDKEI